MPSQASWSRPSSGSAGRRIRAELRACIPRSDVQLPDLEDAEFSASICAGDNFSVAALTRSPSCSGFEALAIGAVTLGRAINQASATCVGVATVALATSSRTASTFGPFPSRYFAADGPRAELLPRSAVERYLPDYPIRFCRRAVHSHRYRSATAWRCLGTPPAALFHDFSTVSVPAVDRILTCLEGAAAPSEGQKSD